MATFPIPDHKEYVYPPYTGITFMYGCVETNTANTETMFAADLAKKYPEKILEITVEGMWVSQHMRFMIKSILALFAAQAEFYEGRAAQQGTPKNRKGRTDAEDLGV